MGHVGVMVPEGHTIQIHPPGAMGAPPPATGMIPNPPAEGAMAAMNATLPQAPPAAGPAPAPKPKHKKKKKKAAPAEKESPAEDAAEGAEEPGEAS